MKPIEEAVIPLSNVEYSYGFGVYETIRFTKGRAIFIDDHVDRLLKSARIIEIEHEFDGKFIKSSVKELLEKNQVTACNIKVLLIGGATPAKANLYILCLNPLFPDRSLYKSGVNCITVNYERPFPHAKSLNMLPSYLAYKKARRAGAYDALLLNNQDELVEGTRTNLLAINNQTILSPPSEQILLGVTRQKVLEVASSNGFSIVEQPILLSEVIASRFENLFITSTSSKIMPISSIDGHKLAEPCSGFIRLMRLFDSYLKATD